MRYGESFVNGEPFAVLLPDDLFIGETDCLTQLMKEYESAGRSIIGLKKVPAEKLKQYGVIKGKQIATGLHEIIDVVEKPLSAPPSHLAIVGRYVFEPEIVSMLQRVKPGVNGEVQLTDAIKSMLRKKTMLGKEIDGERYDIGSEEDYLNLLNRMQ